MVTSDTSTEGWGAHFWDHAVQGHWPFKTQDVVSNIQEMRGAFQALLAFSPFLREKEVLLRMDNKVAVAYLNR